MRIPADKTLKTALVYGALYKGDYALEFPKWDYEKVKKWSSNKIDASSRNVASNCYFRVNEKCKKYGIDLLSYYHDIKPYEDSFDIIEERVKSLKEAFGNVSKREVDKAMANDSSEKEEVKEDVKTEPQKPIEVDDKSKDKNVEAAEEQSIVLKNPKQSSTHSGSKDAVSIQNSDPSVLVKNVKRAREIGRRYEREKEREIVREADVQVPQPQAGESQPQPSVRKFEFKLSPTILIIGGVAVAVGVVLFFMLRRKKDNRQSVQQPVNNAPPTAPMPNETLPEYSTQDTELLKAIVTAERWNG